MTRSAEPKPRESKSAARRTKNLPPKQREKPVVVHTEHEAVKQLLNRASGMYQTVIDQEALFALASTHATYEEMGKILHVDPSLLDLSPYREIVEMARAEQKKRLRKAQFDTAINDRNPTMQIWLGKQLLGQKDILRNEVTGPDGRPLSITNRVEVVAVMPPNGREVVPAKLLPPGESAGLPDAVQENVPDDTAHGAAPPASVQPA